MNTIVGLLFAQGFIATPKALHVVLGEAEHESRHVADSAVPPADFYLDVHSGRAVAAPGHEVCKA